MNNQQIFDTVWKHFVTNNSRSGMHEGKCMLRTPDGRKCAAGILIPDDKYDPSLDDEQYQAEACWSERVAGLIRMDVVFLSELVDCHDRATSGMRYAELGFNGAIKENLERLAEEYSLKIPGENP